MPYLLAVFSITLTAIAQLMLKSGVARAVEHLDFWSPMSTLRVLATSPLIIGGFVCFAVSVVSWLAVLARLDVSQAYPFVSLGIIITMLGGILFLGEPMHFTRLLGGAVIVIGVLLVAAK